MSGSTDNNSCANASTLLEEFRAEKNRSWTVFFDVEGRIVEFCQDKNGSRFIQQRLEVENEEKKTILRDRHHHPITNQERTFFFLSSL
jgi:hypothetical protein